MSGNAKKRAQELVAEMTIEEVMEQLVHTAPENKRMGIPAYNWWNEALHGVARAGTATVFPQAIGMAAAFDEKLLRQVGDAVSTEGRAKYNLNIEEHDRDIYKGLTFWSPNVNIFRDPHWGRGHETYGEDPWLTSRLGVAYVKGIQGEGETLKAAACAKHFAVHSGPESVRHSFNAEVSPKDLNETYLPAFEAAVTEGGVEAVMGAYNCVNGEPCNGNNMLLQETLREKWGFDGHVVSDAWALQDFHAGHKVTENEIESATKALKAGCDIDCGSTYYALPEAYKQGLVTEKEIRRAAVRVFTTRFRLGMFDKDCPFNSIPYDVVCNMEHLDLARKMAQESIVLLKNDGILPLIKQNFEKIAVIGPNAASEAALYGNYNGDSGSWVNNLAGIRAVAEPECRVYYSKGCDIKKIADDLLCKPGRQYSEAVGIAKRSDLIILCLGLDATLEGEEGDQGNPDASGDKKDLLIPQCQRQLCEKVLSLGKPVVLVINGGSALDLSKYEDMCAAILQCWYSGEQGGNALADILFGKVSPSGRLPVTFYYNNQSMPDFTNYSMKNRTYRYVKQAPWRPFGFGLSYTTFTYSNLLLNWEKEGLHGVVSVKNTGGTPADEVVQIYVRYEGEAFEKPSISLCSFYRISLLPGEEKRVLVNVAAENLCSVLADGSRELLSGKYSIYIGGHQPDERSIELCPDTLLAVGLELKEDGTGTVYAIDNPQGLAYQEQCAAETEEQDICKYSLKTAINVLLQEEETKQVLLKYVPDFGKVPMLRQMQVSLELILEQSGGQIPKELYEILDKELQLL